MSAPDAPLRPASGVRSRVLVIAAAIAIGLALHAVVAARLEQIEELSRRDVVAARAQLAAMLQVVAIGLFGGIAALGCWLVRVSHRSRAVGVFPPPGAWSFGPARRVEGDAARRMATLLRALAIALVGLSIAGGALTWYMAQTLLACRAGA